jgi:hypothetical protein
MMCHLADLVPFAAGPSTWDPDGIRANLGAVSISQRGSAWIEELGALWPGGNPIIIHQGA